MNKPDTIAAVCRALSDKALDSAAAILKQHYPFVPVEVTKRRYGPMASTRIFVRDGFIDRYSGDRLIFPPVFRVVSLELPSAFPYHPNWKTDVTHPAYGELAATVDHLVPVTRGGTDKESNWITTSMARNSAKTNWTLEELGWKLFPRGDMSSWDGLIHWFLEYTRAHPQALANPFVNQWHKAARSALSNGAV